MRRSILILVVASVAFGAGVAGSDFIRATGRMFGGDESVQCIENSLCVGKTFPSALNGLDADKFGFTSLICLDGNPNDMFVDLGDMIGGKRCPTGHLIVELRNPTTRTLVEIKNGHISRITKGPLHVIDL